MYSITFSLKFPQVFHRTLWSEVLPECLAGALRVFMTRENDRVMRGNLGDVNMMLLYLVATNVGDNRAEEGR
jgi:hypothetical protein